MAKILDISSDDILMTWFNDDDTLHCPKFVVFLDHNSSSVVLNIRGTFSVRDLVLDLMFDTADYLGGQAHRGILEGARTILDKSAAVLREALLGHPGYGLVVCGHSLGGATAELIAMELLYADRHRILPTAD